MISTAIKHYIYEMCIEVLFDRIINNFKTIPVRFKIGERYSLIIIRQDDQFVELEGVKIKNIDGDQLTTGVCAYREYDLNYKLQSSNDWDLWTVYVNEILSAIK